MQRFFLDPSNFIGSQVKISAQELIHQIKNVLRMGMGDKFVALDNSGTEFECEISSLNDAKILCNVVEKRKNCAEPDVFVTLYQAMPKKMELFETVLQKCTEIGVSEFVPIFTDFCERESLSKRERLERILREASEQCERGKIPTLRTELKFADALKNKLTYPILLHSRGGNGSFADVVAESRTKGQCEIFIGPEGGFSEQEVSLAKERGIKICSLGKRILRTETAAIAASSLILLK